MAETPRLRAGDRERDQVLAVLQEAHAAGRLDLDELDERQTQVINARYVDELTPVVADLPESGQLNLPAAGGLRTGDRMPGAGMTMRAAGVPAPVGSVDPVMTGAAVLSGRDLTPARGTQSIRTFQWWGGDNVDLTEAMGPGITVKFEAVAVMAGSSIFVPEGVRVVDNTVNIMAGNTIHDGAQGDGSNGTLVLTGFSWWAGHDVKLTKEAKKAWKARRKG